MAKEKDAGRFLKTGIKGFDDLLVNGIPTGKNILVEGSSGCGKTIFCLQMAYQNCLAGKKVLFMSFEESEASLVEHMENFGWQAVEMQQKGLLKIMRLSAIDVARSVEALLSKAQKELLVSVETIIIPQDYDPDVLIMDSVTSISSAFSGAESRFRIYMEELFRHFEEQRITTFLVRETPVPTHIGRGYDVGHEGAISFLSDGIICIYSVVYPGGKRGGALEILKMRGESFKKTTVQLEISPDKGMTIFPAKVLKGEFTLT